MEKLTEKQTEKDFLLCAIDIICCQREYETKKYPSGGYYRSDVEIETTLVNGINTIIIQNPVDHGYRFIKFSPEQYEKFKHLLPMEEENNETNN